MSSTAPVSAVTPDVTPLAASSAATAGGDSHATSGQGDQADLRLVIEEDKAAGSYVYKTVDPITGKVISQIPREELLRMREAADYKPGSIVNARG